MYFCWQAGMGLCFAWCLSCLLQRQAGAPEALRYISGLLYCKVKAAACRGSR